MGSQNQKARHLPRSGTLLTRSFRQGERPALALRHAVARDWMGWTLLGLAVPDRPGPLATLLGEIQTRTAAAQEAYRLGPANPDPGGAVVTGPSHHRRRRCQLRLDRPAQRRAAMAHHDHPPAARCRAPQTAATAPARHGRPSARRRQTHAQPEAAPWQPKDTVEPSAGDRVVRPRRANGRDRLRRGHMGQPRRKRTVGFYAWAGS